MNSETFIHYLVTPSLLNDDSLVELKQLTEEYPFFQTAALLYIKNLTILKKEDELNKVYKSLSLRILNSRQLNNILEKPTEENIKLEIEAEVKQELNEINEKPIRKKIVSFIEEKKEILHEDTEEKTTTDKKLQTQSDALRSNISKLLRGQIEHSNDKKNIEDIIESNIEALVNPIYKKQKKKIKNVERDIFVIDNEDAAIKDIENTEVKVKIDKSLLPFDYNEAEKKKIESKKKNMALINAFVDNEPDTKIRIKQDSPPQQEDLSIKSAEENEGIMTETLANIYVKQGHYLKAISVYEKLSLKYPEKNTYFADKINEIKFRL